MIKNSLKREILITAGPTWVAIDKLRVITNVFSGTLGYLIAEKAAKKGLNVTLLLGPGRIFFRQHKKRNLKILRYKFFEDLLRLMKKEIKSKKYDAVIHSAAVADYRPTPFKGKIKSGKSNLILRLMPTLKIVDQIKKWDPNVFLVKFKLEVGIKGGKLIDIAFKSMLESKADLIVANEFTQATAKKHKAYIINKNKQVAEIIGKEKIASEVLKRI